MHEVNMPRIVTTRSCGGQRFNPASEVHPTQKVQRCRMDQASSQGAARTAQHADQMQAACAAPGNPAACPSTRKQYKHSPASLQTTAYCCRRRLRPACACLAGLSCMHVHRCAPSACLTGHTTSMQPGCSIYTGDTLKDSRCMHACIRARPGLPRPQAHPLGS